MKSTTFALILVLALGLVDAQGTCPGGTSACNCQLTNVESLRALVQMEIEAQVEAEVARRFACTGNNNIIETTGNANLANVQYIGGQDTALVELVTTLLYFVM